MQAVRQSTEAQVFIAEKSIKGSSTEDIRSSTLTWCASLLVAKNINMKIIQVWLGHSNMSTTADIYSHLDANAKSEAGRAIESVLSINTESEN